MTTPFPHPMTAAEREFLDRNDPLVGGRHPNHPDLYDLFTRLLEALNVSLASVELTDSAADIPTDATYVLASGTGQDFTLPSGDTHETGIVVIKDKAGTAAAAPITVTPAPGETIDGQASLTLNTAYVAVTLVFSGTEWSIV